MRWLLDEAVRSESSAPRPPLHFTKTRREGFDRQLKERRATSNILAFFQVSLLTSPNAC